MSYKKFNKECLKCKVKPKLEPIRDIGGTILHYEWKGCNHFNNKSRLSRMVGITEKEGK